MHVSRRMVAIVVALVCVIGGTIGSLMGAHSLASNDASNARERFEGVTGEIASRLEAAIQREQDLTVSASTFYAGDSKASPAEFADWARWAQVLRRYPELQRISLVALVHRSQLRSFAAQLKGHATAPRETGNSSASERALPGPPSIVPAGTRPYYCLTVGELARGRAPLAPVGLDRCARGQSLISARNTGLALSRALRGRSGSIEVAVPVYRGLATPPNQRARASAFVGWLRAVLKPEVLAQQALAGHPGYAVQLRYGSSSSEEASAGSPSSAAQTATARLRNGWSLQSFGPTASVGVLSDGRAAWAFAAGVLASLLLGLGILWLGLRDRRPREVEVLVPGEQVAPPAETLYDPLTGMPGAALTLDRAGQMLARASRQSGILAGTLLIDIDWFKDVNDKLGRQAGDQLLKIVAQRLENAMRTHDTVGRLGDDKFAVLVESAAKGMRMDALAQRVIEALHRPVELESFGPSFFMTASIGVAFGRYETAQDMMRDADLALKSAKTAGKDRYTLFNANMRTMIESHGVMEAELNGAFEGGQLFLVYEPICELGSRRVRGVEALLRWQHPKRGVLDSDEFIALAEESGLIVPIGRWALEEACSRAAAWEVDGHPIGVCVKVSENQLSRDGFITDIRRALQQSGVAPGLLTLQIAETAVMDDLAVAAERLREIKQLGVRVSIDDFGGSGYAYHSDLRRLPLDSLRVDRGSLAASEDEHYRNWLLEAILIVGRELSLTVIAKGVESEEQANALQAMGCNMAQGPFMGQPVSAEVVVNVAAGVPMSAPSQPQATAAGSGSGGEAMQAATAALGVTSTPGTAATPGTTATPGTAATPGAAATPGTAATPGAAATPGTAATPGASSIPDVPTNPSAASTSAHEPVVVITSDAPTPPRDTPRGGA